MEQAQRLTPEETKTAAIEKVATHNQRFVEAAVAVIASLARRRKELSAMDVWTNYSGPAPTSPRAIGAAFVKAQADGMIEPMARYIKSGRRSDHNQLLRVWRSRIYERQAPAAETNQGSLFA